MGALVYILRRMQATQPDACVLRPALREEARKAIGARTHITGVGCACLRGCPLPGCPGLAVPIT